MKLLFIADGRSPTAINWITYLVDQGHEVHLVSTYPCQSALKLASLHILPVAFGKTAAAGNQTPVKPETNHGAAASFMRRVTTPAMRTVVRQLLGAYTLATPARVLKQLLDEIRPDLIHAMRIPFEGMLAATAQPEQPFLVSVWGNDFTLHAPSNPRLGSLTRKTLHTITALHTDCQRDVRLAIEWGFDETKPHTVLPGGGGLQSDIFFPPQHPQRNPVVINPRGFRSYVKNREFFLAIPLILKEFPKAEFICPGMQAEQEAQEWVNELGIMENVRLLPLQKRVDMAVLYRRAQVVVSPAVHDGTPNSLLEALACGCFPVAGDIESIREWIQNGENGLLVDPESPTAIAEAVILGFREDDFRGKARSNNLSLIKEKASYPAVMTRAEAFYGEVLQSVKA
ncbi:MAG: glycosyltransferase family 4 protein [Anaerolineales bacterium]|nr:glycosyltransferase family 4 protein [Anaerolineales bacterium]